MTKRVWWMGGLLAGAAVVGLGVVTWRTFDMLGSWEVSAMAPPEPVTVSLSSKRAARASAPTPRLAPAWHDAAPAPVRSAPVLSPKGIGPLLAQKPPPGEVGGGVRLDGPHIALRHDARSAWRQRLSDEELEALELRIRARREELSSAEVQARRNRREARLEAAGLPPRDVDGPLGPR